MLLKTSAAWYTRLSAVVPKSDANGLPTIPLRLRCAIWFETFANATGDIIDSYGKRTVKTVAQPIRETRMTPSHQPMEILDRNDVVTAVERLTDGFGLPKVK